MQIYAAVAVDVPVVFLRKEGKRFGLWYIGFSCFSP